MNYGVTKKDLLEFEIRSEAKFDLKLEALEDRLDAKLEALEEHMDAKFVRLEAKIDKAVEDLSEIILTFMAQVDARLRVLEEAHKR